MLTQPIVTGDKLESALPDPPVNCWKLLTNPPAAAGLDAGAEAAGLDAGAELDDGAAGELGGAVLVLELELQAATPAMRQVAKAITRHREPVPVHGRVPVERVIAPSAFLRFSPSQAPAFLLTSPLSATDRRL
jgi:hypothetical protein